MCHDTRVVKHCARLINWYLRMVLDLLWLKKSVEIDPNFLFQRPASATTE